VAELFLTKQILCILQLISVVMKELRNTRILEKGVCFSYLFSSVEYPFAHFLEESFILHEHRKHN